MRIIELGRFTFPASRVALRAFLRGMREFRCSMTTAHASYRLQETYDTGRELAHLATLRRYEA